MAQAVRLSSLSDKIEGLVARGARVGPDDLLDLLVDVLAVRGWRLSPERRRACAELIWSITRQASGRAFRQAARRLATLDAAPPELVQALAREPIEIAEPVLRYSPHLTGEDLRQVISDEGVEHLRAIATRPALNEATTALVLLRGDRDAILACLANRRARIGRATFAALAQAAGSQPALRRALIGRSDLPPEIVDDLWPRLDAEERARLLAAGFPPERAAPMTDEPTSGDADAAVLALPDPLSLPRAAAIAGASAGVEPALALDLLRGSYDRGIVLLARAAGLSDRAMLRLLCSPARLDTGRPGVSAALRHLAGTSTADAAAVLGKLRG